jgi:hypothetical protein
MPKQIKHRSKKSFSDWRKVNNKKTKVVAKPQHGGSVASDLVMADTMKNAVANDYVVSPRIRQDGYDDGFPNVMYGGSPASDMVMENLTEASTTNMYPPEPKVKGNMNSLNLYQTTGGARRKSKKHSKANHKRSNHKSRNKRKNNKSRTNRSHRNKRNHRLHVMRGGASDWLASNYSLGNINAAAQSGNWVGQFSQSAATDRNILMNPPTLGLAGSGAPMGALEGANVRMVGAPLV